MTTKNICIIGGGISGLAAAHRLCELTRARQIPSDITLLEASNRCGGVIETELRDGFLLEGGPDAFLTEKPWAQQLCQRLGLENELVPTQQRFCRSFILKRGHLIPVPEGLYLFAPTKLIPFFKSPLLSVSAKIRTASEFFVPARQEAADESVAAFIRRRFGQEAYDWIGQPMISGIYAADLEKLSLSATLPKFLEMEKKSGSLLKGLLSRLNGSDHSARQASGPRYSLFMSLKGGMNRMVDRLLQAIPEVSIRTHVKASTIEKKESWIVTTQEGEKIRTEQLCLAVPSHQAAILLRTVASELARELDKIPYESTATINIGFSKKDFSGFQEGFGFVVPSLENRSIIGCTFSSIKFSDRAPEGALLLRAFVGGALHRQFLNLDDEKLGARVLQDVREILKIQAAPLFISIRRYHSSMAQYTCGHLDRISSIEQELTRFPGLHLIGNGYRGIGIPDCVRQAETAAERMMS